MLQHASTPQIAPSKLSLAAIFFWCTAIHRPGAVRHFCPRQLTHQPSPPVAVPIPCISKPTKQVVVRVSPPSIPWTLPQGLHLERVQHMLSHLLAGRNLLYDLIVVDQTKQRTHLNSMLVLGTNRCAFRCLQYRLTTVNCFSARICLLSTALLEAWQNIKHDTRGPKYAAPSRSAVAVSSLTTLLH